MSRRLLGRLLEIVKMTRHSSSWEEIFHTTVLSSAPRNFCHFRKKSRRILIVLLFLWPKFRALGRFLHQFIICGETQMELITRIRGHFVLRLVASSPKNLKEV